jgi:hypothetical protein
MNDDNHSGIPTQAIHEAYLDMQRARKQYREAKDRGTEREQEAAHGELQDTVLTFYDQLYPHLKHETAVDEYWHGQLPRYNGETPPQPEDGKAILQVQQKTDVFDVPDGFESLDGLGDWHDALGLNGNARVVGITGQGQAVVAALHHYEMGLKKLDDWETDYRRTVQSMGGFYETKERETVERVRVPVDRLRRAARSLVEACDELGFLSNIEMQPNTDTTPI